MRKKSSPPSWENPGCAPGPPPPSWENPGCAPGFNGCWSYLEHCDYQTSICYPRFLAHSLLADNVNTPLTSMSDSNVCVDRLCGDKFNTISGSTASAAAYSTCTAIRPTSPLRLTAPASLALWLLPPPASRRVCSITCEGRWSRFGWGSSICSFHSAALFSVQWGMISLSAVFWRLSTVLLQVSTKPFRLFYHTDSQEAASSPTEADNRGFCLDYVQQPCTS